MSISRRRREAERAARQLEKTHAGEAHKPLLAALPLPGDATGDAARVTMIFGGVAGEALVENLRGVCVMRQDLVELALRRGRIRLSGEGLRLRDVRPGALTVEGGIRAVELVPAPEGHE